MKNVKPAIARLAAAVVVVVALTACGEVDPSVAPPESAETTAMGASATSLDVEQRSEVAAETVPHRSPSEMCDLVASYDLIDEGAAVTQGWEPAPDAWLATPVLGVRDALPQRLGDWFQPDGEAFAILGERLDDGAALVIDSAGSLHVCSSGVEAPAPVVACEVTQGTTFASVNVTASSSPVAVDIVVGSGDRSYATLWSNTAGPDVPYGELERRMDLPKGALEAIAGSEPAPGERSEVRDLFGVGEDGPEVVALRYVWNGEDVRVDCGEARSQSLAQSGVACTVVLVEGVPVVSRSGADQAPTELFRDDQVAPLTLLQSVPYRDIEAKPGQRYTYTLGGLFVGDGITCGTVTVPSDRDLRVVLADAKQLSQETLRQPHAYWRYKVICDGCSDSSVYAYYYVAEFNLVADVPSGHLGLLDPANAHDALLAAIDDGAEVEVRVDAAGWVLDWTVDGVGIETQCLVTDTLPPEMEPQYCQ